MFGKYCPVRRFRNYSGLCVWWLYHNSLSCECTTVSSEYTEVRIYKRKQESKKKRKEDFLFSWSRACFFFSWPLSFFLGRFLGREHVFFFLDRFLCRKVFSCFLTFLVSFTNSHLRPLSPLLDTIAETDRVIITGRPVVNKTCTFPYSFYMLKMPHVHLFELLLLHQAH